MRTPPLTVGIDKREENFGDLATKQHDARLDESQHGVDTIVKYWWVPFAVLLAIVWLIFFISNYWWS
jgi:hypothetical protein